MLRGARPKVSQGVKMSTDEELINKISDKTQGSRIQWNAQFEFQKLAAERAGAPTLLWAKIAAVAAIAGAILAAISLLK
jgi:hypothetical protein